MTPYTFDLDKILNRHGSDKGTGGGACGHGYSLIYERLFEPLKDQSFTLLEIGLSRGDGTEKISIQEGVSRRPCSIPSIDSWLDYFPYARIVGFDISDFSEFQRDRFLFVRGDAGSEEDLRALAQVAGHPSLVIDDGSHASYHQILAFHILFACLEPGGIYIIEDINWQPPVYEKTLPSSPKVLDLFQDFQRTGSFAPSKGRRLRLAELMGLIPARPILPVPGWESVAKDIDQVLFVTRTQIDKAIIIYKKDSALG